MSKNYKYSQAEDNYIRDKLDELAKEGRTLESTDDVFDYLDELGVGRAFSDYFESMPRTERRKIVEEHKQKVREYRTRPGLPAARVRGVSSSDSAYESRLSGSTGIERLRQADENSYSVNGTFEIILLTPTDRGEVNRPMPARYDENCSANFMCLATAQELWGNTMHVDKEIPISWRPTKDNSRIRHTRCQLRELPEDENQDVNFVFGSEEKTSESTVNDEAPAAEDEEETLRLQARIAAMMAGELAANHIRKQKRPGR